MTESTLRRTSDQLIPLLIGLIIGFLSSIAMQSGRLATLEADDVTTRSAIQEIKGVQAQDHRLLEQMAGKLRVPLQGE